MFDDKEALRAGLAITGVNVTHITGDTVHLSDGSTATATQIDAATVAGLVAQAEAAMDAIADAVYTTSPSRVARYERKRDEAMAYKAAGYPADPAAAEYPTLVAEAPERGLTERQLADLIIAASSGFESLAAHLEALRARVHAIGADTTKSVAQRRDELITTVTAARTAAAAA